MEIVCLTFNWRQFVICHIALSITQQPAIAQMVCRMHQLGALMESWSAAPRLAQDEHLW